MSRCLTRQHAIWSLLVVFAWTTAGAALWPDDVAPSGLCYATLGGRACVAKGQPWVLTTLDRSDAVSTHMLRDPESLRAACRDTPRGTVLAFASWSRATGQAAQDMRDLQAAFQRACAGQDASRPGPTLHFLTRPVQQQPAWLVDTLRAWTHNRTVVIVTDGQCLNQTLPRLDALYDWLPWAGTNASTLAVGLQDPCRPLSRPLAEPAWALVPWGPKGPPCSWATIVAAMQASRILGLLAFPPQGQPLPWLHPTTTRDALLMPPNVSAAAIPAAAGAELWGRLARSRQPLRLQFGYEEGPGLLLAIDSRGRLQEVGRLELPSLAHVAWAAQFLRQQGEQAAAVAAEDVAGALSVRLFDAQPMPDTGMRRAVVQLPPLAELARFDSVGLDMRLDCTGRLDRSCPYWDHVFQLMVCCDDPGQLLPPCPACSPAAWAEAGGAGRHGQAAAPWAGFEVGAPCGRELGRWVTPFRRRVGWWLTDVSSLRPLLSSSRCTFTLQAPGWAGPWVPTLNLRFMQRQQPSRNTTTLAPAIVHAAGPSAAAPAGPAGLLDAPWMGQPGVQRHHLLRRDAGLQAPPASSAASPLIDCNVILGPGQAGRQQARAAGLLGPHRAPSSSARRSWAAGGAIASGGAACGARPTAVVPLFDGGAFNATFNRRRRPVRLVLAPTVCRAVLVVTLTGHGYDSHNCLEYCSSSHIFTVNGAASNLTFAVSGVESTDRGCVPSVQRGGVPNQYGTWMYGRGGWCDGLEVEPWQVDVTPTLAPAGASNTLAYEGLFEGGQPRPQGEAQGYVMLASYLALWAEEGAGGLQCVEEG